MAAAVQKRKKELTSELANIERQIYELETSYLEETRDIGNIFTGWDWYVSNEKRPNSKKTVTEDRLFSLSSVTSLASKKRKTSKDDGKPLVSKKKPKQITEIAAVAVEIPAYDAHRDAAMVADGKRGRAKQRANTSSNPAGAVDAAASAASAAAASGVVGGSIVGKAPPFFPSAFTDASFSGAPPKNPASGRKKGPRAAAIDLSSFTDLYAGAGFAAGAGPTPAGRPSNSGVDGTGSARKKKNVPTAQRNGLHGLQTPKSGVADGRGGAGARGTTTSAEGKAKKGSSAGKKAKDIVAQSEILAAAIQQQYMNLTGASDGATSATAASSQETTGGPALAYYGLQRVVTSALPLSSAVKGSSGSRGRGKPKKDSVLDTVTSNPSLYSNHLGEPSYGMFSAASLHQYGGSSNGAVPVASDDRGGKVGKGRGGVRGRAKGETAGGKGRGREGGGRGGRGRGAAASDSSSTGSASISAQEVARRDASRIVGRENKSAGDGDVDRRQQQQQDTRDTSVHYSANFQQESYSLQQHGANYSNSSHAAGGAYDGGGYGSGGYDGGGYAVGGGGREGSGDSASGIGGAVGVGYSTGRPGTMYPQYSQYYASYAMPPSAPPAYPHAPEQVAAAEQKSGTTSGLGLSHNSNYFAYPDHAYPQTYPAPAPKHNSYVSGSATDAMGAISYGGSGSGATGYSANDQGYNSGSRFSYSQGPSQAGAAPPQNSLQQGSDQHSASPAGNGFGTGYSGGAMSDGSFAGLPPQYYRE